MTNNEAPNQELQEQIDWLERPHFEEPDLYEALYFEPPYDDEEGYLHG